jgi:hypothetical protein
MTIDSPRRVRARWHTAVITTAITAILVSVGTLTSLTAAAAAAGCRVAYSVASTWSGGFTGNVAVTNLGDPINGWRLTWTFPAGQQVSQAWNAAVTTSGGTVTATNTDWNGALATNATATFGFNGTFSTSNPVPTSFALNGVTCTGATTPGPTATTRPPTAAPTTAAPTTAAPTTRPPTTAPPGNTWNPPANLVTPLGEVWTHQETTYGNLYGFRNYGWDQVMAGRGTINYCVRWDSSATVTATQRDQIQANLSRQFNKWMAAMADNGTGWNSWPYPNVTVKVVGWAVRDRATLAWSDNSVDIYVNNIRENAPQCSEPCGRFFHQDGNYSGCPGGAAHHYDMSLWLTSGFGGGAGGDWGQRIGSEYYLGALGSENVHILLHEIGHTFGLDDFYDWTPTGVSSFIMRAGSATQITEFDKWMLRDWWRHLKSRYGL